MDWKENFKRHRSKKFKENEYSIMPDRIEAGTYLIAAAVTEGDLKISGINPKIIRIYWFICKIFKKKKFSYNKK